MTTAAPAPSVPEPPDRYTVALTGGWVLDLGPGGEGPSLAGRWAQAVADGWSVLRGRPPARRQTVRLELAPEDAHRLHHLFRRGTRVLLVGSAS